MKNTIKMSLAAAVAVSAFSTSAFAGNLEEMIKGVSASGQMQIDFQADSNDKVAGAVGTSSNQVEYDIDITFKAPVNDMITATVGFEADHDNPLNDGLATNDKYQRAGVADDGVTMSQLNFTYANGPVTAIVGKQTVKTPFTYDQKGDGVLGLYNAGAVTVAAAHFENTNISVTGANEKDASVNAAAVIGSVAGVNLSAWYVTTTLVSSAATSDATAYTLNANGKIGPVSYDLRHSSAEADGTANLDAEELTKVIVGMDIEGISLTAGYGTTNDTFTKNGGRIHGVAFDDDDTTDVNFNGEQAYLDTLNDADAFLVAASTTFGKFGAGVTYIDGEADQNGATAGKVDFDELIVNASYAMSKNFNITAMYSMFDADDTSVANADNENDEFVLAMEYKF